MTSSGADPGLLVGGGGGAPTYDFVRFSKKKKRKEMHEIEKILDRREGGGYRPMFINTTQYMWRAPYEKLQRTEA